MWYRCDRCGHVHDVSDVEVTGHYSDCTMWRCPNCKANIDDRPIGWGGSAERVNGPDAQFDYYGVDKYGRWV